MARISLNLAEKARVNRWLLEQGYVYLPWDNDKTQKQLDDAYVELVEIDLTSITYENAEDEARRKLIVGLSEKLNKEKVTRLLGESSEERMMKSIMSINITALERFNLPDAKVRKKVNYYQLLKQVKEEKNIKTKTRKKKAK
jgi:hypothetical protein